MSLLSSVFSCRVCANTPFGAIFGIQGEPGVSVSSLPSSGDSQATLSSTSRESYKDHSYSPRSEKEIDVKVAYWRPYVHPRTRDLWGERADQEINKSLRKIASNVDREEDPIMGESFRCIEWHGEFSDVDEHAVMEMLKIDETVQTHVLRVLAFMFVDDESFNAIFAAAGSTAAPLETSCKNPKCVALRHVVLPNSGEQGE